MIEIFALIYLTGKMGVLAESKGQKPGKWKLLTVLSWIIAEFVGIAIGIVVIGQEYGIIPSALVGYAFAIASYFILKGILNRYPDIDTTYDFDFENKQSR